MEKGVEGRGPEESPPAVVASALGTTMLCPNACAPNAAARQTPRNQSLPDNVRTMCVTPPGRIFQKFYHNARAAGRLRILLRIRSRPEIPRSVSATLRGRVRRLAEAASE